MQKIPWTVPNKNEDEFSLITNLVSIKDAYMEASKTIIKRPGLRKFISLGTDKPTDGQFSWKSKNIAIFVSGTNIYKITNKAGDLVEIAAGVLEQDTKVSFAELYDVTAGELRLFMANGGSIIWTNGTTYGTISGGLTPARCGALTAIDTYLLVTDLDNPYSFHQSVVGDPTNFGTGATTYSSQVLTDPILNIGVVNDKVYVFSSSFIETYYDTGDAVPFSPVPSGIINWGVASRDAIAYLGDLIFILTPERDPMVIQNYSINYLPDDYAKFFQTISVVNDVEFELVKSFGGKKWIIMKFKDANLTVVFDIKTKCFYEWGYWINDSYDRFIGRGYGFAPQWDYHLIGDHRNDLVYIFDKDVYQDNSNPIRTEILTAHYVPNNTNITNSVRTLIDCKNGVGDITKESPEVQWQTRDNREVGFSNQVSIPLKTLGNSSIDDPINNTGRYKSRQHKLVHQDNSEFVLYAIYEELQVE